MRHLPVVNKTIAMLFGAALLAACSGSDTKDEQDAAEAERLAREQAEAQRLLEESEAQAQRQREEAAAAFGNVFYFEYDSATLTPEALDALNAHIAVLHNNIATVRLEGHTDERGTREYNLALGERRANSVRDYMVANGISNLRIEPISYGEERPVAYGSGESNWAQNRRVELVSQ